MGEYMDHKLEQTQSPRGGASKESGPLGIPKELERIMQDFRRDVERIQLPENAPFIDPTFMFLRRVYFQKVKEYGKGKPFEERQQLLRWFIREVDQGLLGWFSGEVRRSYYFAIYRGNFQLDGKLSNPDHIKKDLKLSEPVAELAQVLAEWSLHVELFKDLIDRAVLYGLLPENEACKRAVGGTKEMWKKAHKFSWTATSRKLFVKLIAAVCTAIKARIYKSILPSKEAIFTVGLLYFLVGLKAFPWGVVVNRFTIGGALGGLAGGKLTDMIREFLEKKEAMIEISKLVNVFEIISQNMREAYLTLSEMIEGMTTVATPEGLNLAMEALEKAIKHHLSERRLNTGIELVVEGRLAEEELELMIERRQDDDMIIIDEVELIQTEVEHGFTLITTSPLN
eukprot:TRINITY_DN3702_c0_g5_i1.p1 TRINITY_DN3702_c0_g5~~TRINITY_DN3702_c0_g5_i1.p1  ORF type:complete len:397 (+),score=69.03 TRINITY_DN3702_c0_g5_i1:103-1293(+)